jgi:hypothetical protein
LADLDVIYRNSQHPSKLIDDVLDLSQVEQAGVTHQRTGLFRKSSARRLWPRPLSLKGLFLETSVLKTCPSFIMIPPWISPGGFEYFEQRRRFTERGGVHLNIRSKSISCWRLSAIPAPA